MKIFMISGLGADKRAFGNLKLELDELICHIDWLTPLSNESIRGYVQRIIDKYEISEDDILVGLSFGGMIAVEISNLIGNRKTIIISSARNKYDLPLFYRFSGNLGLYKLIPSSLLNKSNRMLEHAFGIKTKWEQKLLFEIVSSTDKYFMKWAIGILCRWNEEDEAKSVIRIHGTNDKVIPLKNKVDYTLEGGGHFMVIQKAEEISEILNFELKDFS